MKISAVRSAMRCAPWWRRTPSAPRRPSSARRAGSACSVITPSAVDVTPTESVLRMVRITRESRREGRPKALLVPNKVDPRGKYNAATEAAVDSLHEMAGANGIYDTYPLQRMFRDAHAGAAHINFSVDVQYPGWGLVALGGEFKSPTL